MSDKKAAKEPLSMSQALKAVPKSVFFKGKVGEGEMGDHDNVPNWPATFEAVSVAILTDRGIKFSLPTIQAIAGNIKVNTFQRAFMIERSMRDGSLERPTPRVKPDPISGGMKPKNIDPITGEKLKKKLALPRAAPIDSKKLLEKVEKGADKIAAKKASLDVNKAVAVARKEKREAKPIQLSERRQKALAERLAKEALKDAKTTSKESLKTAPVPEWEPEAPTGDVAADESF